LTQIAVNHLTRMQGLHICVAGIEKETREHLRPVTSPGEERMDRELLAAQGGPFELGAVVELGPVQPHPAPPAIEDHRFRPGRAQRIGRLAPDHYLELIDSVSRRILRDAFGRDLKRQNEHKYATNVGKGDRTLTCIRLRGQLTLEIDQFDRLHLRFEAAGRTTYVRITDLRFYSEDHSSLRHDVIEDVSGRLRRGVPAWGMFGLTRAWPPTAAEDDQRHWLQLNGLCLEDRPLGPQP
jgi:hypothetical protein